MIFLTVGTQFAFDRLVCAVDDAAGEGVVDDEIFAQIGESDYKPVNFEYAKVLGKYDFDKYVGGADAIIGHAGMGTINAALDKGKPLLVMPRLRKCGEVVNDHQVKIAMMFERLGVVLAAYDARQVADEMQRLSEFVPVQRASQCEQVARRVRQFIDG